MIVFFLDVRSSEREVFEKLKVLILQNNLNNHQSTSGNSLNCIANSLDQVASGVISLEKILPFIAHTLLFQTCHLFVNNSYIRTIA